MKTSTKTFKKSACESDESEDHEEEDEKNAGIHVTTSVFWVAAHPVHRQVRTSVRSSSQYAAVVAL